MRNLLLIGIYLMFLAEGLVAPFAFALGYVWVDIFTPQRVAWGFGNLPVAMIMAGAAIGAYLLFDRRSPPRFSAGIWLFLVWAGWVTLTTTWAVVPDHAWVKWNWAVKNICFGAFIPYVFRSRIQLEALVLVIIFSVAGHMIPFGIKTALSGGGYLQSLGLLDDNTGLMGESSSLAAVCAALLPLIFWVRKYGRVLPATWWVSAGLIGLAALALITVIGTYARTGLVALVVLAAAWWLRSSHKLAALVMAALVAVAAAGVVSDQWVERMSTIGQFKSETSALTRVAVWMWTLDYVAAHPLGGGFDVYYIDHFTLPIEGSSEMLEVKSRAFHSVYFEVLGEHGYVGAFLFGSLMLMGIFHFAGVIRAARGDPELAWLGELAWAMLLALVVMLVGGCFVGYGFQPFHYTLVGCSIALQQFVARRRAATKSDRRRQEKPPCPAPRTPMPRFSR